MKSFLEKIISNENIHKTDLSLLLHLVNKADSDLSKVININQKEVAVELKQYQPAISKSLKNLVRAGFISYDNHEIVFLFDNEGSIK